MGIAKPLRRATPALAPAASPRSSRLTWPLRPPGTPLLNQRAAPRDFARTAGKGRWVAEADRSMPAQTAAKLVLLILGDDGLDGGQLVLAPGHRSASPGHRSPPPGHRYPSPGQASASPGHRSVSPGHANERGRIRVASDQVRILPADVRVTSARVRAGSRRGRTRRTKEDLPW